MVYCLLCWILFAGCCVVPAVLHFLRPLYDGGICVAPEFPSTIEELPATTAEREPDMLNSPITPGRSSTEIC